MHPGFFGWYRHARGQGCGAQAQAQFGPGYFASGHFGGDEGGGTFGVRRPLRFLAYKLGLTEPQVDELAKVLNELKTERAQAAVDERRALGGLADLVEGEAFDAAKATAVAEARVKAAAGLRDAVVKALGRIHAILDPGQRKQLAYLIRTGTLLV